MARHSSVTLCSTAEPLTDGKLVSVCHKFAAEGVWSSRAQSGAQEAVFPLEWEG